MSNILAWFFLKALLFVLLFVLGMIYTPLLGWFLLITLLFVLGMIYKSPPFGWFLLIIYFFVLLVMDGTESGPFSKQAEEKRKKLNAKKAEEKRKKLNAKKAEEKIAVESKNSQEKQSPNSASKKIWPQHIGCLIFFVIPLVCVNLFIGAYDPSRPGSFLQFVKGFINVSYALLAIVGIGFACDAVLKHFKIGRYNEKRIQLNKKVAAEMEKNAAEMKKNESLPDYALQQKAESIFANDTKGNGVCQACGKQGVSSGANTYYAKLVDSDMESSWWGVTHTTNYRFTFNFLGSKYFNICNGCVTKLRIVCLSFFYLPSIVSYIMMTVSIFMGFEILAIVFKVIFIIFLCIHGLIFFTRDSSTLDFYLIPFRRNETLREYIAKKCIESIANKNFLRLFYFSARQRRNLQS